MRQNHEFPQHNLIIIDNTSARERTNTVLRMVSFGYRLTAKTCPSRDVYRATFIMAVKRTSGKVRYERSRGEV